MENCPLKHAAKSRYPLRNGANDRRSSLDGLRSFVVPLTGHGNSANVRDEREFIAAGLAIRQGSLLVGDEWPAEAAVMADQVAEKVVINP